MKKLLIFDAFGTLISTGNGSVTAARKILDLQNEKIDPVRFYADWKKYHRRHIDYCISNYFLPERDIFALDLKALYEDYAIDRPYQEDVHIMLDSLGHRCLFPETSEAIAQLRQHYRVVIGSTTDTQPLIDNLERSGLVVDAVYTSEMLGWYKPAEHFYRAILRLEDTAADEAVFIGDSPIDDIAGPKKLGIETILIDRDHRHDSFTDDTRPDHIAASLSEIAGILGLQNQ